MKKLHLFFLLSVVFSLCFSSQVLASPKSSVLEEQEISESLTDFLVNQSIELTSSMGSLAQYDAYLRLAQPSYSEVLNLIKELGSCDYSTPDKAAIFSVSDESINAILKTVMEQYNIEMDMTGETNKFMIDKVIASVTLAINGRFSDGIDFLLASSALSLTKSYLQPEGFADRTIVVLAYKDYASATLFYISGDGVITATSIFMPLNVEIQEAIANETIMNDYKQLFEDESIQKEAEAIGFDLKMLESIQLEYVDLT